jgi:hypothetical protein
VGLVSTMSGKLQIGGGKDSSLIGDVINKCFSTMLY